MSVKKFIFLFFLIGAIGILLSQEYDRVIAPFDYGKVEAVNKATTVNKSDSLKKWGTYRPGNDFLVRNAPDTFLISGDTIFTRGNESILGDGWIFRGSSNYGILIDSTYPSWHYVANLKGGIG